jgi:hypothetical protein
MQQKILDQLSAKVAEGWNQRDTTYVYLFGSQCPVSPANDEDKRLFERNGRWIYKGVYTIVFQGQLYRINI